MAEIQGPLPTTTARRTEAISSRTFPGQGCRAIAASASGSKPFTSRPNSAAIRCQKEQREHLDVVVALAQRRHMKREDIEPIEKIFAKALRGQSLGEVDMGRRDDADIDRDRGMPADANDG